MKDLWLEEVISKGLEEFTTKEHSDYWFSLSAIAKIPYIEFPGLTKEQNLEIQEQAKNVLRISRTENNYKEVAITYQLNAEFPTYYKILGDYNSVFIMADENTRNLLNHENQSSQITVISLHNHPNNSDFSLNDLFVFGCNPSIRIMEIINKKGEVSSLVRTAPICLKNILLQNINDLIDDFENRKKRLPKDESILSIFTTEELLFLIKETLRQFVQVGIKYIPYTSENKKIYYQNDFVSDIEKEEETMDGLERI